MFEKEKEGLIEVHNVYEIVPPDGTINWGEEMLRDSRIYGPVLMKRYTGEFENSKTNIEVWPLSNTGKIEDDFVIEVSFKTNEESIAKEKRELIINEEFRTKRMAVTKR